MGAGLTALGTLARLLPAVALLLLGAHFWRAGLVPLAAVVVAMVGLLFVRSAWSARVLQTVLGLGVLEWLRTAWVFASERAAMGQPYARLLVILGIVAAVTMVAALLLQSTAARRHFRSER